MKMTRPKVTGAEQVTIAEEQEEYLPIVAARVRMRVTPMSTAAGLLFAFEPTKDERERIYNGEDIYISLVTFGEPMQPIMVMCGKEEAAQTFGLGVE